MKVAMHVVRGAGNERTWWGRDPESPSLNATFVVTLVICRVSYTRTRAIGRSRKWCNYVRGSSVSSAEGNGEGEVLVGKNSLRETRNDGGCLLLKQVLG
jgi:hypothetical protein